VGFLGATLAAHGAYPAAVAEGERALARAVEINNPVAIAVGHILLSFIHIAGGEPGRALAASRASIDVAEKAGDPLYVYLGYGFRAWAQARQGDDAAAATSLARALEVAEGLGGRVALIGWFGALDAEIRLSTGDVDAALARAEQVLTSARTAGDV